MSQQFDDLERQLPHAVGPEKSILSSMLQEPAEFIPIAIENHITAGHFYLPSTSILFETVVELYDANKPVELVSLVQHMLDTGRLDRAGGPATITDIYGYAPAPMSFMHHLQLVKDKHVLRQLVQVSTKTISEAYDAPDDVPGTLDAAERDIMAIRDQAEPETITDLKTAINQVLDDMIDLIEERKQNLGIPCGFPDLDRKTLGLKPGEVFVIAARPSMGKSALMGSIAEHIAFDEKLPVHLFSLEMTTKQLIQRMMGSRARFDFSQLAAGHKPDKGSLLRIQRAALDITQAKDRLLIDDTPGITITALRAKARRAKTRHGTRVILIDYLQLMRSKSRQAENSREREVAEISAGIKSLAKELQLPIVVLAQLNRDSEKRNASAKGRPRMSDLRESGSIEQDADLIGLLHREAYHATTEAEKVAAGDAATLILAKNRNGPTGDIPLTWMPALVKFVPGTFPTVKPAPEVEDRYNRPLL